MSTVVLPENFKPLLWSYDISKIDLEKDKNRIIVNVINYGDLSHWRWLLKTYSIEEVKKTILSLPSSEFRPQVLKLISLLLDIPQNAYDTYRITNRGRKIVSATA
ncbi:MAG: hypothetical protein AAB795_00645 [Patescibacteria group bacterium]